MGPPQAQTANIGFHMAFYSDYARSKLLGIENSFQVQFSDCEHTRTLPGRFIEPTILTARSCRILSPEYCDVCRGMFLEQLNYNLFHWVSRFPRFYFQALAGLDSHSMIFEAGSRQIQKDLRSPLRQCFALGDRLEHADAVSVPDRRSGDNLRRPTKIAGPAARAVQHLLCRRSCFWSCPIRSTSACCWCRSMYLPARGSGKSLGSSRAAHGSGIRRAEWRRANSACEQGGAGRSCGMESGLLMGLCP